MDCVNALHRAYSISTNSKFEVDFETSIVSMPFIGLTPFLRYIFMEESRQYTVSMPFIGLTPFLLCLSKLRHPL